MARGKVLTIEQRIEKAQGNVDKAKAALAKAEAELAELKEKNNEKKRSEILNALVNSEKSMDEIIKFIKGEE